MGHLLFLGFVVFFFALITGRIYFDYKCAIKNKTKEEQEPIEIPVEGKRFNCKKLFGIFCLFLIPSYWLFAFLSCTHLHQKNDPDSHIIFWLLVDSVLPVSAIFLTVFITSVRSYVFVNQEGFDYYGPFRKKVFQKNEIENVCRIERFIFVKRKQRKISFVIDNRYKDNDILYGMLCQLTKDL